MKNEDRGRSPEELEHIAALTRRAHWLEQRLALTDPGKTAAQWDRKEHAAVLWALLEAGADYKPSRYADRQDDEEAPPIRDFETYTPPSPAGWKPRR